MPIVVIINNQVKDDSLFCSNSKSLVVQSGFAVTDETLSVGGMGVDGRVWLGVCANTTCSGQ